MRERAAKQGGITVQSIVLGKRRGRFCFFVLFPAAPLAKNYVIAKPVRTLAVAIRIPRPQAPLPKGGWHGEAVTGGYIPVPHLL